MVQGLIAYVIKWINAFPSRTGISKTMSPSNIVEGKPKPDFTHKLIFFGSYAIVYTGTENNMNRRGVPSIALNESNDHGGHYFMSLYTGKRLHSYDWNELPIDEDVIDMIKNLAQTERSPIMKDKYPMFEWLPGIPILDNGKDNSTTCNEIDTADDNPLDIDIVNDDDDNIDDDNISHDNQEEQHNINEDQDGIYITECQERYSTLW